MLLSFSIENFLHCFCDRLTFGAQPGFHTCDDPHRTIHTPQPKEGIVNAATLFQVFNCPPDLFVFRPAIVEFHVRFPKTCGLGRARRAWRDARSPSSRTTYFRRPRLSERLASTNSTAGGLLGCERVGLRYGA